MIDEGICEAHHAELILKESWGMKQGPLEMADRLGLDLVLSWMRAAAEGLWLPLRSLPPDSTLCP
jgi:3-hydroxyacyl-CoA dehydrogenase